MNLGVVSLLGICSCFSIYLSCRFSENRPCCCSPSYRPLVLLQAAEWLLPLLELAQWGGPSDRGLPLTPEDEHSAAWPELAKVAEADALLSLLGLEARFT